MLTTTANLGQEKWYIVSDNNTNNNNIIIMVILDLFERIVRAAAAKPFARSCLKRNVYSAAVDWEGNQDKDFLHP